MTSSRMNLVMTIIGFSVSILFIVFICTRLICARIQLRIYRRSFRIASRSDLNGLERGLHTLEPPVLANFPVKKYGDEYFSSSESTQMKLYKMAAAVLYIVFFSWRIESICTKHVFVPYLLTINHLTSYLLILQPVLATWNVTKPLLRDKCMVCLAEYHEEEVLRILPHCGHYFHINCIDIWLLQHCTCPVCRISLRESSANYHMLQPLFSSRSHLGVQPTDIQSYYHFQISSRPQEDTGMGPSQEIQSTVPRDDAETVGGNTFSFEGNKHVGSPSYA